MKDNNKTNEQLLNEISKLNNKIAELEKIRLIGEKTTDFISIIGLDGKYTYASPSYKLLGYNPDELIGSDGIKQLHPDDRKRMLPMLKQVISGLFKKGTTKRFEIRLRDKSGKYHDAESIATLIRDDSGNPRILSVVRDITERKQAEEKLKSRNKELETWAEVTTGRELKMLELKKEINELLEKSGEKSKYEIPI